MTVDVEKVLSRISIGKICPSMQLVIAKGADFRSEHKALGITMTVYDANNEDLEPLQIFQSYPIGQFESEQAFVAWVYEKVKAVLVHELAEFFRLDGVVFQPPEHPLK